jgi:hypothetical protein
MENNLGELVQNYALLGLLIFAMVAFTAAFISNNGQYALNDGTDSVFSKTNNSLSSNFNLVSNSSDSVLNITSNTDPEKSYLGSKDSVATSYQTYGTVRKTWDSTKILFSYVFSGEIGFILLIVFSSLLTFLGVMLIIKLIRQGVGA